MGAQGSIGPIGPAGPAGAPGPQGPAGPPGTGAYSEDEPGFAGFTVATFTGNIGGRTVAHGACAAEYPGAHLCHASEYLLSTPAGAIPAAGAWLDSSVSWDDSSTVNASPLFGRYTGNSCVSFTTAASGYNGTYVQPNGGVTYSSAGICGVARPLACCNGAPKHVLAGFSAAAYTGNLGGRAAAHAICKNEFAGSHMCHASEYLRTVSSAPVPAPGAWLDSSTDPNGAASINGAPAFGRYTGNSCVSFTTDASGYNGTYVQPNGGVTYSSAGVCGVARRIACCL
jgi:hypothetical protein